MFNLLENVEFNRTVIVTIPADGGTKKVKLPTRFRLLSDDDLEGLDLNNPGATKDYLRRAIVNFHDLKDDEGDVPYSDAVRDRLLSWEPVRSALVKSYAAAVHEGREGN